MKKKKQQLKKISLKALKTLENYSWPGNVRELENILRLADFMAFDNIIDDEHLEFRTNIYSIGKKDSGGSIDLENLNIPDTPFDLNDLNNRVIEKCLEKFNNNSAKVANFLGVSRQTIYRFQKKQEEL